MSQTTGSPNGTEVQGLAVTTTPAIVEGLTSTALSDWSNSGLVVIPDVFTGDDLSSLQEWVTELETAPGDFDGIWQYDEVTPDGTPARCRTENFLPHHTGLRNLLATGVIPTWAGQLLGCDAVVYKEKLNYKNPGGAGFRVHQDAPAYPGVDRTLACLIAVDDAHVDNGCLEVAAGAHRRLLPDDGAGCVAPDVADELTFSLVEVSAGSVVFFHEHLPHRSRPNNSDQRRRTIYVTFTDASESYTRDDYYAQKQKTLRKNPDQLSLISHFAGDSHATMTAQNQSETEATPASDTNAVPTQRRDAASADPEPQDSATKKLLALDPRDTSPAEFVDCLFAYMADRGASRYDETVTQLEHGLQAAHVAASRGGSESVQVAALLHDIGHLFLGEHDGRQGFLAQDLQHEKVAEPFLNTWFGEQICRPVALHVPAKRYIVRNDAQYVEGLSESSQRSLKVQGGAMSDVEAAEFEADPWHADAVAIRYADDLGKDSDATVPGLEHWRELVLKFVSPTIN